MENPQDMKVRIESKKKEFHALRESRNRECQGDGVWQFTSQRSVRSFCRVKCLEQWDKTESREIIHLRILARWPDRRSAG